MVIGREERGNRLGLLLFTIFVGPLSDMPRVLSFGILERARVLATVEGWGGGHWAHYVARVITKNQK